MPIFSMDQSAGLQDLNFKVLRDLHRAFKTIAALRQIPMKRLLEECFRCWLETHGTDKEKALFLPEPTELYCY